ncbi:MAG: PHP domain-containing protein [Theionarchaea archaeon]|nr:PHP domain-containing protein [Theionarchaea archaeon]MBU7038096.1 PHP domain-containing protein [Theionarchaea archaeon]
MKLDLHVHTTVSDGTASPEEMVAVMSRRGMDGFSITDHDTPGSAEDYETLAGKYGMVYIPGIEVTSQVGHLLMYTTPENSTVLGEFDILKPLSYYISKAQSADVVLSPAHPFDHFRHGIGDHVFDYTWTAVETFNGSTVFPFANRSAHAAAATLHIPGIGGSDAHTINFVGKAYTEVEASTPHEVIARIREGVCATGGVHISLFQFSRRILESKMFK